MNMPCHLIGMDYRLALIASIAQGMAASDEWGKNISRDQTSVGESYRKRFAQCAIMTADAIIKELNIQEE